MNDIMARYFVHLPPDGSPAIYWRAPAVYAGMPFHFNLNLLARAAGDDPSLNLPAWADLVPSQEYDLGGTAIPIQPFAFTPRGGNALRPEAIPIGPHLSRFLNDPLPGERLDLSLPFYDEEIKLGPSGGGYFRKENNDTAFHGGTDFNKKPRAVFEVCSAAEGRVAARDTENGRHGGSIVLTHATPQGQEFRTIYQHLDVRTIPSGLKPGAEIRRGGYLGRTADVSIIHLHFGVAVRGPSVRIAGVAVPVLWYLIDPWGVYDYYEHDTKANGNYLPPEGQPEIFMSRISGASHSIQWQSEPLAETLPVARHTGGFKPVVQLLARGRSADRHGGTLPAEDHEYLVWLKDDPEPFTLNVAATPDQAGMNEIRSLLEQCFFHGKPARLEYRYLAGVKYIMAVTVGA